MVYRKLVHFVRCFCLCCEDEKWCGLIRAGMHSRLSNVELRQAPDPWTASAPPALPSQATDAMNAFHSGARLPFNPKHQPTGRPPLRLKHDLPRDQRIYKPSTDTQVRPPCASPSSRSCSRSWRPTPLRSRLSKPSLSATRARHRTACWTRPRRLLLKLYVYTAPPSAGSRIGIVRHAKA